ncbi:hypothetical protein [Ohtaekwangia koreensis]|uniref:Uncharacterized protein n=1 Tax=Ohtaekwangia koreensis TaxID=688867 RepID=A0A1T5MCK7_9BACT|nr:hypothetical protein [Ohtaekwangia koreensis]SKC85950.1 hypothetical protein SAMN05660236_5006 [Ohtaekwangia koreensis]
MGQFFFHIKIVLKCIYRGEEENGDIAGFEKIIPLVMAAMGFALWVINAPEGLRTVHKVWWKMFGKEIGPSGNKFPVFGK